MRKYVLVLLGLLFLTDEISCFLRLPRHAEFQYRDVVDAKLSQGARTRRSIGGVSHPEWYNLDLDVEGSNIKLHLTRNDDLSTIVPTLALNTGVLTEIYLKDQEESIFYQDIINGASFVVQYNRSKSQHMFGTFHQDGNDYILQKDQRNTDSLLSGVNRFEIIKEIKEDLILDDFLQPPEVETVKVHKTIKRHHRQKRATGSNQIELLIVCDYAVYKYWYDQSDKTTAMEKEADAESSVRQYYAFVLNGMDAMYKNIQTTSYSISVLFAGIVIAKTADDSTWTENIKNTSFTPNTVNSDQSLQDFKTWMNANSGSLPNHDHAMLFTRYNLEYKGSTGNAGLAYLGTICGTWRQSIVEDKFNFIIITVAAHELGHGLSSNHDGDGNNCLATDAYIMAPSSGAKVGEKATHPWIFSSCSTDYFTTKIDELEATNENCMKSLGSGFDPTALTPYDQNLPGLIYDADAQCMQIYGNDSYLCRFPYENNYTTICTTMYCYDPAVDLCYGKIPGDGTLCDNKKFCTTGMCKDDVNAPQGDENCLYGDYRGKIFSNVNWTCAEMVEIAPHYCDVVPEKCCSSCAPFLNPTTTVTQVITTQYEMTETPSTTQMTRTLSTTQTTETPSTTQMSETPSTTPMTETPSTTQMTMIPSTPQITETPSTTQMTQTLSTTQRTETPSTTQITETPSTTQTTKTPPITQMTETPSTTKTTKTPTTQMTETQSTTQMTETSPSTTQMTTITSTTQMTETLSATEMAQTPTSQMTESPTASQTTETQSATQMTQTQSTTQMTESPTRTQMSETQPTTQMTETPSTKVMTEKSSTTQIIEKSTASLMTKDATITQVTDSTKQATNQNKDTTEQKKTTTQLDETTTLQSFKTSPSENATYSESTKKAGVTTKLGTPTMTITSEAETWPDITSMIPETTVLSQSTRKFQGAMTLAKDWNPSYSDEDSTEYQSLKANFTEQLTEMYSKTSLKDDFVNVTITGFREGSVVVDYILELQSNAPQTEQNIVTITKQAVDDIKADQSSNLDLITEVNSQLVSLTEVIETTTTGTTTGLTIQDSGDIGIGLIAAIVAVTVVVLITIVVSAVVIVTWKRSKEKRITSDTDSTSSQTVYHRHRGYDNHGMVSDYTGRQGSYMEHYMPRGLPLYQGHQNFQDSLTSSTQFY